MHTGNRNKFIYYIASLVISVVIVILTSNFDIIAFQNSHENLYDSGTVEPYLRENGLSRFAINNTEQQVEKIELLTSTEDTNYDIAAYYQEYDNGEFIPIKLKIVYQERMNTVYCLKGRGIAKNFYVDIYEEFKSVPTINVKSHVPSFKIKLNALILGVCVFFILVLIYFKREFLLDIYNNRDLLKILLVNDLKSRYAGAFLGGAWSYVQPVISIFVFWFVFQKGFKNSPVADMPFIVWFLPAYISWMYFQDVISYSTSCLREYSYLVKKIKFRVNIIPAIKLLAAFRIHICFAIVTFIISAIYGIKPSIKYIQLIYYSFAMVFLLCGISWIVSALSVFMKDMTPIIGVILQLGYFAIPIFWNEDMLNPFVIKILKINPAYYIVQGYRDSMCGGAWFWEYQEYTIYYWILAIVLFACGIVLFDGAKKHFSDLL